jgi:hypothetical protein
LARRRLPADSLSRANSSCGARRHRGKFASRLGTPGLFLPCDDLLDQALTIRIVPAFTGSAVADEDVAHAEDGRLPARRILVVAVSLEDAPAMITGMDIDERDRLAVNIVEGASDGERLGQIANSFGRSVASSRCPASWGIRSGTGVP